MAALVLEGTWEEISAHAGELAGKRLRVIVDTGTQTPLTPDIPVVGPPNEGMLAVLREIEERQKNRLETHGDSVNIIRQGRTGPLYGRESISD